MYTLRIINSKCEYTHFYLGKSYTLVDSKCSPESFTKAQEHCNNVMANSPKTFAFIVSENGSEIYPILSDELNYIMTDSGKTFSTIKPL